MKANLVITCDGLSAPIVIAKLEQWQEWLAATGIPATWTVEDEDPPAAVDLAAQTEVPGDE